MSYKKSMFGLDKKGAFKVWDISVYETQGPTPDSETLSASIVISHGQEGGKLTTKTEYIDEGKQGRTPFQQAVNQADGRLKKQLDKGYRYTKEELSEVPLLPMLASDYNKVGHRIEFPCYGSVKYDGVRCLAIKNCGEVRLESRTGQPYSVPHLQEELNKLMYDGQVLDGEIYKHGYELQEIVSAVKRTDPQKEINKVKKAYSKNDSEENEAAVIEAILVEKLRQNLEFHIFDIPMGGDFETRILAMDELFQGNKECFGDFIEMTEYVVVSDDKALKQIHHPRSIREGFEGFMLRNKKGIYESGKRSGDLQKFKTFLDEEFLILDVVEDKQGNGVFLLKNNVNGLEFQCVMGDLHQRKTQLHDKCKLKGKFLNVKFQTRYKSTLLPQFGVGQYIRDGYLVEGVFVPYD